MHNSGGDAMLLGCFETCCTDVCTRKSCWSAAAASVPP